MKVFRVAFFLLLVLLLIFSACSQKNEEVVNVVATPIPIPTLSLEQLLADALNLLDGGKYEEAILAFNSIIKIEPKSFDAQFGLGKAYRGAKRSEQAIVALKAAKEIKPDNVDATLELSGVLLDMGSYAEAETLLLPLVDNSTDLNAGLLLMAAYAGEGRIDDVSKLLLREEYLRGAAPLLVKTLYFGGYDSEGERSGKGVGIYYDMGIGIYYGDYIDNVRCGQGTWISDLPARVFTGQWANDMPNGYGEMKADGFLYSGVYENGLENGEMTRTHLETGMVAHFTSEKGNRKTFIYNGKASVTSEQGVVMYYYAKSDGGIVEATEEKFLTNCGIYPWAKSKTF